MNTLLLESQCHEMGRGPNALAGWHLLEPGRSTKDSGQKTWSGKSTTNERFKQSKLKQAETSIQNSLSNNPQGNNPHSQGKIKNQSQ